MSTSTTTTTMMMHTIATTTPAITPLLPEDVLEEEPPPPAGVPLDGNITVGVVDISPPGVLVVDVTDVGLATTFALAVA